MIKDILRDAEEKMQKSIEFLTKDLSTLRAGRANRLWLKRLWLIIMGSYPHQSIGQYYRT